jgi:MFS family permease
MMAIQNHSLTCHVSRLFRAEGQRQRRMAVMIAFGGVVATVLTAWLIGKYDLSGWWIPVPFVIAAVAHVGWYRICLNDTDAWKVANGSELKLDERQIRVRNMAYMRSYQIVAGSFVLGVIYAGTAYLQGYWLPTEWGEITTISWAVLLGTIILPAAFIAWTEPDSPDEFEA